MSEAQSVAWLAFAGLVAVAAFIFGRIYERDRMRDHLRLAAELDPTLADAMRALRHELPRLYARMRRR